MKILVTGGTGFIGSHIVEGYVQADHEVVVLDAGYTPHPVQPPDGVRLVKEDINQCDLQALFHQEKFDVVNHHAAQVNVRLSINDPIKDAQNNIIATLRLLQACMANEHPACKFIFASSGGAIYGEPEHKSSPDDSSLENEADYEKLFPTPETAPMAPTSPYGISKLSCEKYIEFFRKNFGLRTMILRYANVYGPRQDPAGEAGVVSIFADALLNEQQPTIFGDGTQTRDFVYVKDVARANLAALRHDVLGIVNIGTSIETSVNQLYQSICRVLRIDTEPRHAAAIPSELLRSVVANDRAAEMLDWRPLTNLEAGLAETVASFIKRA